MIDYNEIFRQLSESDADEEFDDTDEIEEDDVETEEINLGSIIKVLDSSSYTAEELSLTDDEFESFKSKVDNGLTAIVFDVDDENPELFDIVFEDGLEVFDIPKLNLEISEFVGAVIDTPEDEEFEDEDDIDI